jgi:hypothetical protein
MHRAQGKQDNKTGRAQYIVPFQITHHLLLRFIRYLLVLLNAIRYTLTMRYEIQSYILLTSEFRIFLS